ncbi:MAG: hypothetical protein ABFS14_03760 [Gemmatimonadota bacterium]
MTGFALGFMLVSIVSVTVLVVYCYVRILKPGASDSGSETADPGA